MVPCDSDQAGIFVHDEATGHLVLQADASYPPDAYPPIIPNTVAGPGEGEEGIPGLSATSEEEEGSFVSEAPTAAPIAVPQCLDVLDGSVEDGAVMTLVDCAEADGETQRWKFSPFEGGAGEGSLVSVATGQCATAGWPFFTGAAFEMSEESRDRHGRDYAVVLLNEAEEPVEFDLSFPSEGFAVRAIIGPRSIQTILA